MPRRASRLLKGLALGALVLLLLVVGAVVALHSTWGQTTIRRAVLEAAGATVAGRIELGGLFVGLNGRLHAEHFALYTPEGDLVAQVKAFDAALSLSALWRQRVVISQATLTEPEVFLVVDERGLNVSRALASRSSQPSGAPSAWSVVVERLEVVEGRFEARHDNRFEALSHLEANLAATVALADGATHAALQLRAAVSAPLVAPLSLDAHFDTSGPFDASLRLADAVARVQGNHAVPMIVVDEFSLPPSVAKAGFGDWPLLVPLGARGRLGVDAQSSVELNAGSARGELKAMVALAPLRFHDLLAQLEGVNLHELVGAERPSVINVHLAGALDDANVDSLTGSLSVDTRWRVPDDAALSATLQARLIAKHGEASIERLVADAAGVSVNVVGRATLQHVQLGGRVEANDLSKVPLLAHSYAGVELPQLEGQGHLRVGVNGPTLHPHVVLEGELDRFRFDALTTHHAQLKFALPDLGKPFEATVGLHAQRVAWGATAQSAGTTFEQVALDLVTRGRSLSLDLKTKGLRDVTLHAGGRLDADSQGLNLTECSLVAPAVSWALQAPSRLEWAANRLEIEPLVLKDGRQLLSLEAHRRGQKLKAALMVNELDLSRLPSLLLPADVALGGVLNVSLDTDGWLPRPDSSLKLQWQRGSIGSLQQLSVALGATLKKQRLNANVTASSLAGAVDGELEVPLTAVLGEREEPVAARLSAHDFDIATFAGVLNRRSPVGGEVSAEVVVAGTSTHPQITANATAKSLSVDVATRSGKGVELEGAQVGLTTETDGHLRLVASVAKVFSGAVKVAVDTPFTWASLRQQVPTTESLRAAPFHGTIDATNFDLQALDAVQLVDDETLAGRVSLTGVFDGTPDEPTARLTLGAQQMHWAALHDAELAAHVELLGASTLLTSTLSLSGNQALEVTFKAPLGLAGWRDVEHLGARSFALSARVLPVELRALSKTTESLSGTLTATLNATGTFDAPTAHLEQAIAGFKAGKSAIGSQRLVADIEPAKQSFALAIGGIGSDDLKARGTLGFALGWSALRRGVSLSATPVAIDVVSRELDVAFLSQVHPMLRAVGGRLKMKGSVSGTVGAPTYAADAQWLAGRLALTGFGDYRDIALSVHADNERIDVDSLSMKSGAGRANLSVQMRRQKAGTWHVASKGSAERFPLVYDDQLMAAASLDFELAGDSSPSVFNSTLRLPHVEIELPELRRKDLQSLDRPSDIVVLRVGNRAYEKRRRAAAPPEEKSAGRSFYVTLDAPRNVWVKSSDVNVELGLSEGFSLTYHDALQLNGVVSVKRDGIANVIGRKFTILAANSAHDVKGSTITFSGLPSRPYIDVAALHVNEKENVKVTITATGFGTDAVPKAVSEPPMPESDIYTLLATGRRTLDRSTGSTMTAEDAVSVVGQLAASQVKTMLAKKLPIDVLNFEASDNFQKLKFDVGKYLSDSVYLGVTAQPGANPARGENPWAGRIELQMSRNWSLEAYAGTAPAIGADVVWSKDF